MNIHHARPSAKRFYRYSVVALIFSLLSNVPTFMEFTTSVDSKTKTKSVKVTPMRIDDNYIIFYKNIFEGICLVIAPLLAMVFFNGQIIYELVKKRGALLSKNYTNKRIKNENNLARVLIVMDVVFLLCNSGRVIVNLWEITHIAEIKECMGIRISYKVHIFE